MTIRVLLVDDHEIVRSGLKSLFKDTEIKVVGEASNGKEALRAAATTDVDLVILDVRMPRRNGIDALVQNMNARDCPSDEELQRALETSSVSRS